MNKCCGSSFYECTSKVKRYEVFSKGEGVTYPNRYWGVSDYCETCKEDEIVRGFNLIETSPEAELLTL